MSLARYAAKPGGKETEDAAAVGHPTTAGTPETEDAAARGASSEGQGKDATIASAVAATETETPISAPETAENVAETPLSETKAPVSAPESTVSEPEPAPFVDNLAEKKPELSRNFDIGSRGNHLGGALRTRPVSEADVNACLDLLKIACLNADICLSDSQLLAVKQLPYELPPQHQPYGANFSMEQELDRQLTMTSALRQSIIDSATGRPKDDVSPREAKEVISACTTLFSMLMKHQETVRTYERQIGFEKALSDTVREHMSSEQREIFLTKLAENLEKLPS